MSKKTQAKNAMKPDPAAAKAEEAAKKVNEETAAADKGGQSDQTEGTAGAVAATDADASAASQGTEAENPPGPDERAAETGTKQDSGKGKKAQAGDPTDGVIEKDPAEKEAEDYDLDNPHDAKALIETVINDLVSFGPAVTGALSRKPKVEESWNKLIKKARKLQSKINHENDKARK